MIGFILGLTTIGMYSARGLLSKRLMTKYNTVTINGISRFQSLVPTLIILYITNTKFSITATPEILAIIVFFIIFSGISINLSLKALKYLSLGTYSAVSKVGIFFTALLSILLLNEIPSIIDTICILLIVILCISVSSENPSFRKIVKEFIDNPGLKYTLLSQLLFAISSIGMRYWVQFDNPLVITIVITIFGSISNLTLAFLDKRKPINLRMLVNHKFWTLSLVTAFALIINLTANKYIDATVFQSICGLQIFFSIILGQIFFNEHHNKQTYIKFAAVMLLCFIVSQY